MSQIHLLVEGILDEAVARRIVEAAGHAPGDCYGKRGSGYISDRIHNFNKSASYLSILTLVDLMDTECDCAPEAVSRWLPHANPRMFFRIVVREIESWVLADREAVARFLDIRKTSIPLLPESLEDPKQELINLARRSRKPFIKEALVPEPGVTARIGRLYNSEIARFIREDWHINEARKLAPSLDSCIRHLTKYRQV